MKKVLRDFRRNYHKSKDVYDSLVNTGVFGLKISFDENKLQAEHSIPQNEDTDRFVVLMRHFLSPTDSLYYQKVWGLLLEEFSEEIPTNVIKDIENRIATLNQGYIGINVNGDNLTAEGIYRTLSDGIYFGNDEAARSYLQNLSNMPVIGHLFWYQFYQYTLMGFELISNIFSVVLEVEKSEKYLAEYGETATENHCIYCLTAEGTFQSEEHIFPESLGNDDLVLPKGFVCDKCNNQTLAVLDNVLLTFEPIAFLQVQFVPHKKDGKFPKANFQNLVMERTKPNHIQVTAKDRTGNIKNKLHIGDDWYSFSLEMRGKRFVPKTLGRALYKIALGMVAYSQGQQTACSERFDSAREFIKSGEGVDNNMLIQTSCIPNPQVRVAYRELSDGIPFVIDIFGIIFMINLENSPKIEINNDIKHLNFASYSLSGS